MTGPWDEPGDPIEDYLDRLLVALTGSPRQVRRTLTEVEAHLDDAVAASMAAGLSDTAARAAAVRDLGPVEGVATRSVGRWAAGPMRQRIALGLLLIGGVGGVAIGLGGLLAAVIHAIGGDRLVGAPFPTGSYTASDCARWLSNYPHAQNCLSAMTQDHANDFLRNTAAVGIAGLLALVAHVLLRRRWWNRSIAAALPRWVESAVGACAACAAAVVLSGQAVDAVLVTRGTGAGASLALAIAAAGCAVGFAVAGRRRTRRPLISQ